MTNSHLLGFVTFGGLALMASLAWLASYKHPAIAGKPSVRRKTRRTALFLLALGAALGYGAFAMDNRMRITTLYEVMVEGSVDAIPGTPAPLRTVLFTVERPGVAHKLFLSPTSERSYPATAAAEVSFSLHDPLGEALLSKRSERFAVRPGSRSARADWEGKTFSFTPVAAGPHTVQVMPLTTGIPRIQVRIVDPLKRDGERMLGY